MTSKLTCKWELTKTLELKIHTKPKDIAYHFLKDVVLKIEQDNIVGYKTYWNGKVEKFNFEKINTE